MPIFEYLCRSCCQRFEAIVQSSTVPACPQCQGTDLEKQLSVFAVHTGGGGFDSAARPCGRGPEGGGHGGSCGSCCGHGGGGSSAGCGCD